MMTTGKIGYRLGPSTNVSLSENPVDVFARGTEHGVNFSGRRRVFEYPMNWEMGFL